MKSQIIKKSLILLIALHGQQSFAGGCESKPSAPPSDPSYFERLPAPAVGNILSFLGSEDLLICPRLTNDTLIELFPRRSHHRMLTPFIGKYQTIFQYTKLRAALLTDLKKLLRTYETHEVAIQKSGKEEEFQRRMQPLTVKMVRHVTTIVAASLPRNVSLGLKILEALEELPGLTQYELKELAILRHEIEATKAEDRDRWILVSRHIASGLGILSIPLSPLFLN
jgi:hypothetical protein